MSLLLYAALEKKSFHEEKNCFFSLKMPIVDGPVHTSMSSYVLMDLIMQQIICANFWKDGEFWQWIRNPNPNVRKQKKRAREKTNAVRF